MTRPARPALSEVLKRLGAPEAMVSWATLFYAWENALEELDWPESNWLAARLYCAGAAPRSMVTRLYLLYGEAAHAVLGREDRAWEWVKRTALGFTADFGRGDINAKAFNALGHGILLGYRDPPPGPVTAAASQAAFQVLFRPFQEPSAIEEMKPEAIEQALYAAYEDARETAQLREGHRAALDHWFEEEGRRVADRSRTALLEALEQYAGVLRPTVTAPGFRTAALAIAYRETVRRDPEAHKLWEGTENMRWIEWEKPRPKKLETVATLGANLWRVQHNDGSWWWVVPPSQKKTRA